LVLKICSLVTPDGELTNKLTHPRFGHEKKYRVLLARRPDYDQLDDPRTVEDRIFIMH
jgi:16S rRNA U516 pseudouridylate synthase RsuA-like enzyme